jgi:predicted GTPase
MRHVPYTDVDCILSFLEEYGDHDDAVINYDDLQELHSFLVISSSLSHGEPYSIIAKRLRAYLHIDRPYVEDESDYETDSE